MRVSESTLQFCGDVRALEIMALDNHHCRPQGGHAVEIQNFDFRSLNIDDE
jgi:hypothetical protein